jgi:serine/threonine protein kinase
MPTIQSSTLQRACLLSGLVTREQLEQALQAARMPATGPPAPRVEVTDDQLARQMVSMGVITTYQAEQLKAGRTKFTLGDYLITDFIAQGGMGQVFKAEHRLMGRQVAIKVLPQARSTPQAIANFTREIRTQAILDHDNLVRAFDAGHDGNVYYLVTEYVPGTDLRRLVKTQGALTVRQAASIISQAARGLHDAHTKGLIHRDVKPGNILVAPDGKAKVSDLGLADFLRGEEGDPRMYRIVGTADYIAPEQIKYPESATAASDIYSLGCTLYYAITAKVPYPGGTTRDKARRHLSLEETPWHPRRFNSEIPEEFVEVIADMMQKEADQRVQTALEVVAKLEPWSRDVSPFTHQPAPRSPWMPPPLPAGIGGDDDLQVTQEGSYDSFPSDSSLAADTENAAQQTSRTAPPLPQGSTSLPVSEAESAAGTRSLLFPIAVTLAISVPIAMMLGALIAIVVLLGIR